MSPQSVDEISYGTLTELPDALARGAAVASSQLSQAFIGLL
jgi:hypothetical protein